MNHTTFEHNVIAMLLEEDEKTKVIKLKKLIDFIITKCRPTFLKLELGSYLKVCEKVYENQMDVSQNGAESVWNRSEIEYEPRHLFDSISFDLDLERIRVKAFETVFGK